MLGLFVINLVVYFFHKIVLKISMNHKHVHKPYKNVISKQMFGQDSLIMKQEDMQTGQELYYNSVI